MNHNRPVDVHKYTLYWGIIEHTDNKCVRNVSFFNGMELNVSQSTFITNESKPIQT